MSQLAYKKSERAAQAASACYATRDMLAELDPEALYFVFEANGLNIHQVAIVATTPNDYQVRLDGKVYLLSRALIDAGHTGHGRATTTPLCARLGASARAAAPASRADGGC